MSSTIARRLTIAATGVAVGLVGLGNPAGASASGAAQPVAPTATIAARPTLERQVGTVLECSGDGVSLTLYENSLHGSSLQVVLGDPEDDVVGYVEQATPFVTGGSVDVAVPVQDRSVTLSGTVTPTGRPTKLAEPVQDNGEQIVTRGTHTQLSTDLSLTNGGTPSALTCTTAFAFDLQVRRVTLYGG